MNRLLIKDVRINRPEGLVKIELNGNFDTLVGIQKYEISVNLDNLLLEEIKFSLGDKFAHLDDFSDYVYNIFNTTYKKYYLCKNYYPTLTSVSPASMVTTFHTPKIEYIDLPFMDDNILYSKKYTAVVSNFRGFKTLIETSASRIKPTSDVKFFNMHESVPLGQFLSQFHNNVIIAFKKQFNIN